VFPPTHFPSVSASSRSHIASSAPSPPISTSSRSHIASSAPSSRTRTSLSPLPTADGSGSNALATPAIVGIAIGAAAAVGILLVTFVCFMSRRHRARLRKAADASNSPMNQGTVHGQGSYF
jgi:hypothetical protein